MVTKNAEELAAAETQLFAMSQKTRVGYETTVSLFTRLARSTENLGVSQQAVMRVTETINKAMIVSGTSAEQASGALMQLGQAFASGALRGDELNSVMEGMPRVAKAIADGMGITVGELRKLGAQGKLTGAEVFAALQKMGDDIDSEFSKMPMTVGQSMTILSNSLMLFVAEADKATGFTSMLGAGIVVLSNNIKDISVVVGIVVGSFALYQSMVAASALANSAFVASVFATTSGLGVLSGTTALATGALNALKVAMLSNPFTAVAVAVGVLATAFYALGNSQRQAKADTDNLVTSLKALADARSVEFGSARMELQTTLNEKRAELASMRAKEAKLRVGSIVYETKAMSDLSWEIIELQGNLDGADYRYKKANEAASDMAKITPVAAAGVKKVGAAAKEAIDPLQKYRDALAGMVEEGQKIGMTPEQIKAFEVEKLALEALAAGRKKYNKATQDNAAQGIADAIRQQGMSNALNQYAADIMEQLSDKLKDYAKSIADANKTHSETIKALKDEATLLGLVGVEREKAVLALEKEAYVLKFGTAAWEEYHAARTANINAKSVIDKDIEALQTLTSNLETAAGMIGGKVGRSLQGILKLEVKLADGSTKKLAKRLQSHFQS